MRVSGTEKLMISLSSLFNENGHQVYLFPLITPFDKEFIQSIEQSGKPLKILFPSIINKFDAFFWKLNGLTISLFNWSSRSFFLQKYLSSQCKKLGIELSISNSHTTDSFMYSLHKMIGLKYVIIDHGSYVAYITNGEGFNSDALKNSSVIVGVSKWTVQTLRSKFPDLNIRLVYNGYVSTPSSPVTMPLKQKLEQPGYFIFCMHGRGDPQKGWEIAIEAYYLVKNKGFKVKLLILAESDHISLLKTLYERDSDLMFAGFCYNLADIFKHVNAGLVLSKRHEAFGLSTLDYFNSGIPVIASRIGGIPEVVNFERLRGGLLVDVVNGIPSVEDTAKKMEELILNVNLYNALSEDAKAIAENFSLKRCFSAYEDLFNEVLKVNADEQ